MTSRRSRQIRTGCMGALVGLVLLLGLGWWALRPPADRPPPYAPQVRVAIPPPEVPPPAPEPTDVVWTDEAQEETQLLRDIAEAGQRWVVTCREHPDEYLSWPETSLMAMGHEGGFSFVAEHPQGHAYIVSDEPGLGKPIVAVARWSVTAQGVRCHRESPPTYEVDIHVVDPSGEAVVGASVELAAFGHTLGITDTAGFARIALHAGHGSRLTMGGDDWFSHPVEVWGPGEITLHAHPMTDHERWQEEQTWHDRRRRNLDRFWVMGITHDDPFQQVQLLVGGVSLELNHWKYQREIDARAGRREARP